MYSRLLSAALLAVSTHLATAQRGQAPKNGREVLEAMRAAYDGKWYHTLTFTQKTTSRTQDGSMREATWLEALSHTGAGTHLRIDFGDLKDGNGVIYTPDSSWRFRAGKAGPPSADGNPFLPLIEGVYVQPVDRTIKELVSTKVELSKMYQTKVQGVNTWVVGASSAADSTSPQFWVDADRKLLTRMILTLAPNRPPYDIHLEKYERVGSGWLATKVMMYSGGALQQGEEYSDWKVGMNLDPALFDPAKFTSVKHWSAKERP
jgi:hypothetical protein